MLKRKQPQQPPRSSGWSVEVTPASYRSSAFDYRQSEYKLYPVEDEVAVRILWGSESRFTFGCLKITDPEFEDKVTTMKAAAEERAAALQAVGAK